MEQLKLLRPFRRRLLPEAILKSLITGAIIIGALDVVVLIILHLLSTDPGWWLLIASLSAVMVLAVLLFVFKYYPRTKTLCARVDDAGLYERASTMYALRNENTYIAQMQRKDAANHLTTVDPSKVRWSVSRKSVIACIAVILSFVLLSAVPYNIMEVFAEEEPPVNEAYQRLLELIQQLRDEVNAHELDEYIERDMHAMIDEFEASIQGLEDPLDMAAEISMFEDRLQRRLERLTRDELGEALADEKQGQTPDQPQEQENTQEQEQGQNIIRELGNALIAGDAEAVTAALDILREMLNNPEDERPIEERLAELSQALSAALEASETEEGDALRDALEQYTIDLDEAAEAAISEEETDINEMLDEAFASLNEAVAPALDLQLQDEGIILALLEILRQAKQEILGNEEEVEEEVPPEEVPVEEVPVEGEEDEEEPPPPEEGADEEDDIEPGEEIEMLMTEPIYDPFAGSVPYGEVFAFYYAEYLEAIDKGKLDDGLTEVFDGYYGELDK